MLERLVDSFRKIGVTAVAGYSALVMGLGCGDTSNYYDNNGGEGNVTPTERCEDHADRFIGTCCRSSMRDARDPNYDWAEGCDYNLNVESCLEYNGGFPVEYTQCTISNCDDISSCQGTLYNN